MAKIAGTVGAVYCQTGASTAFTDEATTVITAYTRYQITNADKRYWNKNVTVTVKVNAVVKTTGYKLEYLGGYVVFDTNLASTDTVTVSGEYYAVAEVGQIYSWSLDGSADTEEVTDFETAPWKSHLPTLKDRTISAEWWWGDSQFFDNLGKEYIIVLYVDSGTPKRRYETYGVISGISPECPVDSVVSESIDIQGSTKEFYYREG